MNRSGNENIDSEGFSKSNNIDHETGEATLPQHPSNPIPGYSQDRSVMWTVPNQRAGLRSKSPSSNSALASDVTGSGHAQHDPLAGAAVAGAESTQRTQSAAIVIEGPVDFDQPVVGEVLVNEGNAGGDPKHTHQMPATAIQRAFDVIRHARQVLLQVDEDRRRRQDTEPQEGTIAKYKRSAALVDEAERALEGTDGVPSVCLALAKYADKGQSFTAMRSAVLWRSIERVRGLLQSQDKLQRLQPGSLAWTLDVDELGTQMHLLAQVRDLALPAAIALSGLSPRPSASKKGALLRINQDWRSRFLEVGARSEKYRMSNAVLACTGLRPIELSWGVSVRRRGPVVAMKVLGGKCRETAGQPWRVLFVPAEKLPTWFLERIGTAAQIVSAPTDAMRSYLARLSSKVFEPKKNGAVPILSAYVFRHALATDMRTAGWGAEEIAGAFGERSARTSRWYGLRKRGSKAPQHAVSVERGSVRTALPVAPVDKSWIAGRPSTREKPKGSRSK